MDIPSWSLMPKLSSCTTSKFSIQNQRDFMGRLSCRWRSTLSDVENMFPKLNHSILQLNWPTNLVNSSPGNKPYRALQLLHLILQQNSHKPLGDFPSDRIESICIQSAKSTQYWEIDIAEKFSFPLLVRRHWFIDNYLHLRSEVRRSLSMNCSTAGVLSDADAGTQKLLDHNQRERSAIFIPIA